MNEMGEEPVEDCPGHLMSPNRNWVATNPEQTDVVFMAAPHLGSSTQPPRVYASVGQYDQCG